jgi:hypothetical protein
MIEIEIDRQLLKMLLQLGVLDALDLIAEDTRERMEIQHNFREVWLGLPAFTRQHELRAELEKLESEARETERQWRTWVRSPLATVPIEVCVNHQGVFIHFEVGLS